MYMYRYYVPTGISKEGWYIFKNLVTELLILAIGFLTFVPAIQVSRNSVTLHDGLLRTTDYLYKLYD